VIDVLAYIQVFAVYIGTLLLGRGGVFVLSFGKHANNPIYQLLVLVTNPILKVTRWVSPKQIADKHLGVVAFFLMFWLYFGLAVSIPMLMKA
jgi:uncharacterized protein YggT (Ycf19 family)